MHLKHPVVDWKLGSLNKEQCVATAETFLARGEAEVLAFVPPYGYSQYCECPNCYGGAEGNNVLTWSIDKPEELVCRFCKTVVYPNPKYPEDKTLTGKNALGETVSFPYYYNEKEKAPHFFTTHLQMHKRRWLTEQVMGCARAYYLTQDDKYARRVALVLDKIAQVYPHYPVMQNLPRRFLFRESQQPPFHWDSGKWNYFHNEVPIEVIPAYDLTYGSPAYEALSKEKGYDVRERVEKDFLRAATEAAMKYPDFVSNVIGYSPRSAALLGQVIAEPRFVHWAFGWMEKNVNTGFFRDGMWKESPSYHYMTVGGLKSCFSVVEGYSDPAGYVDPVDGRHFEKLDPTKELPLWAKCQRAPEVIGHPSGISATVHDTHPYEKRATPRQATASTIAPGFGHASLGRGRGAGQMQAQLHFSGSYGHAHYDSLNLTLFGKERELCPDIGYTWTQMRYWATSSLGHNTVVVDRKDQATAKSDGNLLLYFPGYTDDPAGLAPAMVEADGKAAYSNVSDLDLYRRTLLLVPVSEDDAYAVDVFRVRGGRMHDWTLNGDADRDTVAKCSVPLSGKREWMLEQGEEWKEPKMEWAPHNPYGMVRDVARGECESEAVFDYSCPDETEQGLRVHLMPGGPTELWLGRSPSVRRMGVGTNGDMRKAYDFWMPKLIARRQGEGPLQSTFVAVHEPHGGQTFLGDVKRLKVTPDDGMAVALEIRHGKATDFVFSALEGSGEYVAENGVRFQGRGGVARVEEGRLTVLSLYGGGKLEGKGWGVSGEQASLGGAIESATRKLDGAAEDALITAVDLPAGEALKGQWMIVSYANGLTQGHEISRVEKREGKTVIVTADDHALRVKDGVTEEAYFPLRKIEGQTTFTIPSLVSLSRQSNGAYKGQLTTKAQLSVPQ